LALTSKEKEKPDPQQKKRETKRTKQQGPPTKKGNSRLRGLEKKKTHEARDLKAVFVVGAKSREKDGTNGKGDLWGETVTARYHGGRFLVKMVKCNCRQSLFKLGRGTLAKKTKNEEGFRNLGTNLDLNHLVKLNHRGGGRKGSTSISVKGGRIRKSRNMEGLGGFRAKKKKQCRSSGCTLGVKYAGHSNETSP